MKQSKNKSRGLADEGRDAGSVAAHTANNTPDDTDDLRRSQQEDEEDAALDILELENMRRLKEVQTLASENDGEQISYLSFLRVNGGDYIAAIDATVWVVPDMRPPQILDARKLARSFFRGLDPKDAAEYARALHLTALHSSVMGNLQAAARNNGDPALMAAYTDAGLKATDRFSREMDQFERRRGRVDQSITVQHQYVNVAAGANAIVGPVKTGGRLSHSDARALSDQSMKTISAEFEPSADALKIPSRTTAAKKTNSARSR